MPSRSLVDFSCVNLLLNSFCRFKCNKGIFNCIAGPQKTKRNITNIFYRKYSNFLYVGNLCKKCENNSAMKTKLCVLLEFFFLMENVQ
jgi:hypothetical protein